MLMKDYNSTFINIYVLLCWLGNQRVCVYLRQNWVRRGILLIIKVFLFITIHSQINFFLVFFKNRYQSLLELPGKTKG